MDHNRRTRIVTASSGRAPFRILSDKILECEWQAEQYRLQAEEVTDPVLRAELSELEKRWLYLARSYEFTERVARTLERWQGEVVQP
jgi:hypothetical protein